MRGKIDQPISVAQIGLGRAGRLLHLPALKRLRGVRVVVAADPDAQTHSAAGAIKVVPEWRDVLEFGARAAVVATPSETHAEISCALLSAGIHVFLEKPLATELASAEMVARKAQETGLVLRMGYAFRFHPLWQRAKSLVDSGALGRVLVATGRFVGSQEGSGWSAPILNLSLHHVDLLSWLLEATPCHARATLEGTLVVTWPNGSTLSGEYQVGSPCDRLRITSGSRSVAIDRLTDIRLKASGIRLGRAGLIDPRLARAHLTSSGWERSFEIALGSFFGAITGELPDHGPNFRDGLAMVATGEAIIRSLDSGKQESVVSGQLS